VLKLFLGLAYLVAIPALGLLALRFIAARDDRHPAEFWLPVSFGLGLGIQCFVSLSSILLLGQIYYGLVWGLGLVLLAAGLAFPARVAPWGNFVGLDMLKGPDNPAHRPLYWSAAAMIFIFISVFYYNAMDYPMASYDGRAIWGYKAKILEHEHTVLGESFLDPERVHYHREYPLMVPVASYGFYRFIGEVDDDRVRFVFSSLMLFFVLFLFGALRRAGSASVAMFFALVFAGAPFREFWVIRDGGAINSGESDFPLAFFATVSLVSWCRWWSGGRRQDLLLGGLFTGFALMTKQEGIVVFCVTLGANGVQWLLGRTKDRGRAFALVAAGQLLSVAAALPWLILSRKLPMMYDENYFQMLGIDTLRNAPNRLPVIWEIFRNDVTEVEKWNYTWFVFLGVFLVGSFRWFRERRIYLDAAIVLWLMAYLTIYLLSPLNLIFHLNTSLRRLMAHIFPVAILQIGFFVSYLCAGRNKAGG